MDQEETWHAGLQVGLSQGDFVSDGHPAAHKKGGTAPPLIVGPCLLWPNGWIDQDVTECGGRPRPRRHCVRWGPRSPPRKGHSSPSPVFSAHVYCGHGHGRPSQQLLLSSCLITLSKTCNACNFEFSLRVRWLKLLLGLVPCSSIPNLTLISASCHACGPETSNLAEPT